MMSKELEKLLTKEQSDKLNWEPAPVVFDTKGKPYAYRVTYGVDEDDDTDFVNFFNHFNSTMNLGLAPIKSVKDTDFAVVPTPDMPHNVPNLFGGVTHYARLTREQVFEIFGV